MHLVASIRLSVRPFVTLSCLNRLTFIFGIVIDLDLGQVGIEGQGRRSKVKVKHWFYVFYITVTFAEKSRSKVGVKVKGQGHGSRSSFWRAAVDIRGSALPSAAKSNRSHYQF